MTKYSKVLTSTLLASSVIAFSASASNESDEITVTIKSKQASPAKVYLTDDVRKFTLVLNADDKTNKSGKTLGKGMARPMNVAAPAIEWGPRKGIARDNGKTYEVVTSKPYEVEYAMIQTHPEAGRVLVAEGVLKAGQTKSRLVQDKAADSLAREFDLITAARQADLLASRKEGLERVKAELEWYSASIKNLTDAYTATWGLTVPAEKVYAALYDAKVKNDAARPPLQAVELTRYGQVVRVAESADAEKIAQEAIQAGRYQQVTKAGLFNELALKVYGDEDTEPFVSIKFPAQDEVALSKEVKDLAKLAHQVKVLSDKVGAEAAAFNGSKSMSTYYQPVMEGKWTPKPKEAPAASTDAAPATTATETVVEEAKN